MTKTTDYHFLKRDASVNLSHLTNVSYLQSVKCFSISKDITQRSWISRFVGDCGCGQVGRSTNFLDAPRDRAAGHARDVAQMNFGSKEPSPDGTRS
jgi:hypothetical protein